MIEDKLNEVEQALRSNTLAIEKLISVLSARTPKATPVPVPTPAPAPAPAPVFSNPTTTVSDNPTTTVSDNPTTTVSDNPTTTVSDNRLDVTGLPWISDINTPEKDFFKKGKFKGCWKRRPDVPETVYIETRKAVSEKNKAAPPSPSVFFNNKPPAFTPPKPSLPVLKIPETVSQESFIEYCETAIATNDKALATITDLMDACGYTEEYQYTDVDQQDIMEYIINESFKEFV